MNTIATLLKMTQEDYEMLLMDWWLTYCQTQSHRQEEIQKLMSNQPLFNWWCDQLQSVEREFIENAAPFEGQYTKEDAKKLYAKHAYKLQKYYKPDLFKKALQ